MLAIASATVPTADYDQIYALLAGEIHVCCLDLLRPMVAGEADAATAVLAADELHRADRFRFSRDRDQFVRVRGFLRRILARYLGCLPEAVSFHYNAFGKPALAPIHAPYDLRFNVSHCRRLAILAFSRDCDVGVDVEDSARRVDDLGLARSVFSTTETEAIERISDKAERQEAFLASWTRKEALLKGLGTGFGRDPTLLDPCPSTSGRPTWHWKDPQTEATWTIASLAQDVGHPAALAAQCSHVHPHSNCQSPLFSFPQARSLRLTFAPAAPPMRAVN